MRQQIILLILILVASASFSCAKKSLMANRDQQRVSDPMTIKEHQEEPTKEILEAQRVVQEIRPFISDGGGTWIYIPNISEEIHGGRRVFPAAPDEIVATITAENFKGDLGDFYVIFHEEVSSADTRSREFETRIYQFDSAMVAANHNCMPKFSCVVSDNIPSIMLPRIKDTSDASMVFSVIRVIGEARVKDPCVGYCDFGVVLKPFAAFTKTQLFMPTIMAAYEDN